MNSTGNRLGDEQALSITSKERFLLDAKGIAATAAEKWLKHRRELAMYQEESHVPRKQMGFFEHKHPASTSRNQRR